MQGGTAKLYSEYKLFVILGKNSGINGNNRDSGNSDNNGNIGNGKGNAQIRLQEGTVIIHLIKYDTE